VLDQRGVKVRTPSLEEQAGMIDPFGRKVTYIRFSVTDRCDLRCFYCMPNNTKFIARNEVLTLDEMDRLCSAFIQMGVNKIRITGGEPLIREETVKLCRRLSRHLNLGALQELTLTTNGTQLADAAEALRAAGLKRINVSLDTLEPKRFHAITGADWHHKVMEGLNAAKAVGLEVRINTVALAGINDKEHHNFVEWCGMQGFDLAFIEVMPLGTFGGYNNTEHYMPMTLVRSRLASRWTLDDIGHATGGPARYVRVIETGRRIGFITPITHNFCESCNRVRVTCTGTLFACLGNETGVDLRIPLRTSNSDHALNLAIRYAISRKPKGHDFGVGEPRAAAIERHMSVTGG
jgi:cyclic pyranopterin phosphate synthase